MTFPQAFIATGPNYHAIIPAALSRDDARRIACEDSGLMPWAVTVEAMPFRPALSSLRDRAVPSRPKASIAIAGRNA